MVTEIFNIKGMTCNNCVAHIEKALEKDVAKVSANFVNGTAIVNYDKEKITREDIVKKIEEAGYLVKGESNKPINNNPDTITISKKQIGWAVVGIGVLIAAYFLYGVLGNMDLSLPEMGQTTSLFLLFLVGLLTGFHCISMCGGFMISYSAKNAIKGEKGMKQHLIYGFSKTVSYTIIGAIFGLIGSIFLFTPQLRGTVAILAGIFMIFYAFSMMGIKFFRRFQFNPKWLTKIATKKHEGKYKAPMMTGLLNGLFIACGPLQAMYIYAAGTGSMTAGAVSLMAFGLGTLPVLLGFGGLTNVISGKMTRKILKVSAVIVLILGLIMLNRGLALTGSGYDVTSIIAGATMGSITENFVIDSEGYQIIEMDVVGAGFVPNSFVLKKDVPVKWVINGLELNSCNNAIQVPSMNLAFDVEEGRQTIEFTPTKKGVISWSCWMGMIPGSFIVTDSGEASANEIAAAEPGPAGSCGGSSGGCGCGGSR